MHITEFDYQLPAELIAQEPLELRSASRMLVLDRNKRNWADAQFAKLVDYLQVNDVLVLNNTRVFPARIRGQRDPSGGRVEVLLVREIEPLLWEALVHPGQRLKVRARMRFGDSTLQAEVVSVIGGGMRVLRFESDYS